MMKVRLTVVYRLKDDLARIEAVQRATRTTKNFGIEPTHGMFGSDEWWERIASGELQLHTLSGEITDVYMGSMNDWPEFKMMSRVGEESRWTREQNTGVQDSIYRIGRHVEIDYVLQRSRPESFAKGAERKQILEIRINDADPS